MKKWNKLRLLRSSSLCHHWSQKSAQHQEDDADQLHCSSITEITTAAVQLTLFFVLAQWTALIIFAQRFWRTGLCITRVGIPILLEFSIEFSTAIGRACTGYLLCFTIIPTWTGDAIIALQTVTLNENRQLCEMFLFVYCFCALLVPSLLQTLGS